MEVLLLGPPINISVIFGGHVSNASQANAKVLGGKLNFFRDPRHDYLNYCFWNLVVNFVQTFRGAKQDYTSLLAKYTRAQNWFHSGPK